MVTLVRLNIKNGGSNILGKIGVTNDGYNAVLLGIIDSPMFFFGSNVDHCFWH
jgi:hypothetical protein